MNFWIDGSIRACLDSLKRRECFAMEARRINAFAGRQIERSFAYPLLELTAGTCRICALAMIETDREMNKSLQEEPPGPDLFRPSFFQYFMALEKLAVVEE